MLRPKIKFTKRVVLALAVMSTMGATGTLGLMHDRFFPEAQVAESVPDPAPKPEKPAGLQPIEMPAEDATASGSLLAPPPSELDGNVALATYEAEPPKQEVPADDLPLPPPAETILRANGGDDATTTTVTPAGEEGVGTGNDSIYAPYSLPATELDPPPRTTPTTLPGNVPLEGPAASNTVASPEAEKAEVTSSLRDAARAAIADSVPKASIYDADIYGSGTTSATLPPNTVASPRFDASTSDAPSTDSQSASIYGTRVPATDTQTPPRRLPSTTSTSRDTYSSNSSFAEPPYGSATVGGAGPSNGDGTPGANSLEGLQSPALTLEKTAPEEIQVGKEAEFQLKLRNVGNVAAHDVIVLDRVPRGTRFVNATPEMNRAPDGQLMWQLGTLQPGDEAMISLQLLPTTEGEIGSVAQVLFGAKASIRTICTKPELTLNHTGPQRVMIGEAVTFDITVSNPGTGAATGITLEENVPEGLAHVKGNALTLDVGTLKPGETRRMQLAMKADKPGIVENVLLVRGDGNLIAKDIVTLEVIAPSLEVALSGPGLRFLEREATYQVAVANPGTAPAREVELVTYLPKGMKFVSADHKGQYEPQNHAVYWSLEELPPRETGVAKLTLLPLETGEQKLSVEGRAELGIQHSHEKLVQVDSLAELQFTIADEADPIEVGSDTTYVITLSNTGSSAATNIRLTLGLPASLKPVGGDGPTRVVVDGVQVAVDPLARLAPGEQAVYRLKVHGREAGVQRIRVQLVTDETPVPVTKEEITRIYADQ